MECPDREVIMRRAILTLVALTFCTAIGANEFNLPPGKWWENERLSQRIGLSSEQRDQIDELVYDHAHRMIDLNADIKRSELELANLVGQPELDNDRVRAAFGAFQQARQALEMERFEMLLAVREVLSTEQWGMIQEMQKEMRRRRMSQQERRPGNRPQQERFGEPRPDKPPDGPSF
jgi:Spy/CpxP family protein refolding chaperone